VDHAPGIAGVIELQPFAAQLHGTLDTRGNPLGVDCLGFIGAQYAQGNARVPVPEAATDETTLGIVDLDHAARWQFRLGFMQLCRPHPRVAWGTVGFQADDGEGGVGCGGRRHVHR